MFSITKKIRFEAAHRLLNHAGKCRYLHGHSYVAEITVEAQTLTSPSGMVMDFAEVKGLIMPWVDENWDHNILLGRGDPMLSLPTMYSIFNGRVPYVFDGEPTVERMAKTLFMLVKSLSRDGVRVAAVRIHETETSWAECRP